MITRLNLYISNSRYLTVIPVKQKQFLIYLLMAVPVIAFAVFIFKHALNVPFMDDMELVDSINVLKKGDTNPFTTLVRQQNDHRSTFPRLGIILSYLLSGTLDFRLTILLGYFNLILLGYAFYLVYRSANKGITLFLPVVLMLFSPLVYYVHLWSLTAFQHTLSIAFSILCLYFLQPEKKASWLFAFPIAIAATLTNLDGISVMPVCIFWLMTQRRWKHSLIFLVLTAVYLAIYFTDFKLSSASQIGFSVSSLPLMAHAFVVVTGSFARFISDTHGIVLSTILGSGILITFIALKFFPRIQDRYRFSFAEIFSLDLTEICFLRMLGSMAMIMIGRYAEGVGNMIAPRFQVYSVSVAILFYLFLVKNAPFRKAVFFKIAAISIALVLSVYSYKKYDRAVNFSDAGLKADSYNYTRNRVFLHQYYNLPDPDPAFYENYNFPEYFGKNVINNWKAAAASGSDLGIEVTEYGDLPRYKTYIHRVKAIRVMNVGGEVPGKDVYLGLTENANSNRFYLVALKDDRPSWKGGKSVAGEFDAEIPAKMKPGSYTATLCWLDDEKPRSVMISKNVSL
ncbi:DUF4832 domain-containing protein [Dyadobacter sp. CY347]|uniref:DUF4832 domain-containing protein n=1 Tax=Dyadobacter sp. CY347 TaxID=2909336 RepID=UPI001F410787|nr:DUF4832 domain-containing protein [Dyadobacter sp. CY347]MCF2489334.1 DUF4832 domain-containing protein [Dyadobacter sp. CY347]